jgi:two-component system response regulator
MPAAPVILVCDDDADDRFLVQSAFTEAHVKADFRFTSDGQELIDYLENCNERGSRKHPCPNIILLDLNMPRMDGRQALKWIKSHPELRSIPVVIYTTSSDNKDVRQCYRLGANTFMTKCAEFGELVDRANTFAKYWMDVAKLP